MEFADQQTRITATPTRAAGTISTVHRWLQIQALDRTQPVLPMGRGYVEGVSRDITTQCRHQEIPGFLRQIKKSIAKVLDVHLVVDNYCTQSLLKSVPDWRSGPTAKSTPYSPTPPGSTRW
jgi:putative transposase